MAGALHTLGVILRGTVARAGCKNAYVDNRRLRTSFIVFATLPSILTLLYYGGPHFVLHPPIDDARE